MRILITILAVYLIVVAGGISIGSITMVGKMSTPMTNSDAIFSVLLMLPLVVLGILLLREPIGKRGNKGEG